MTIPSGTRDKRATLDTRFTATLVRSPAKGGWTYVVMATRSSSSAPGVS